MKYNRFSSYHETTQYLPVEIEGQVPAWLDGYFISTGPGNFHVGDTQFKHWFDGFALLKSVHFHEGKVSALARYLDSRQYTESERRQTLYVNEFGTTAPGLAGCVRAVLYSSRYDNANVNVFALDGGDVVAVSETPNHWVVDKATLRTKGKKQYQDDIKANMCLPHPVLDSEKNVLVNIMMRFGRRTQYQVVEHCMTTGARKVTAVYQSDVPFYLHSFLLTKNYVVLCRTPTELQVGRMLNPMRPIVDAFVDRPGIGSAFIVIDRRDGRSREFPVERFFCYHGCNAYEYGDDLVLDLVTTPSGGYAAFTLDKLNISWEINSDISRYIVSLKDGRVKAEVVYRGSAEFPRINERQFSGKKYQHVYVADKAEGATWFNQIREVDVQNGDSRYWSRENTIVGEPVFIEDSRFSDVGDGILMSLITDEARARSGLVLISASTFEALAIIWLSCYFPPGLHGNFFR